MFINVLVEGTTPTNPVTKSQVGIWANNEVLAFSCLRDPDGAGFNAKKVLGIKMTTYIVERATRKIVVKGSPETDVLPQLDTLP